MHFSPKTKNNRLIFIVSIVGAVSLFYFWYYPKVNKTRSLSTEYKIMKADLDGLYAFIGGKENLKDNIINMRRELKDIEGAFPSEKEISNIIKHINDEAKRFKVNVSSLKPNDLYQYKNPSGSPLVLSGRICKCMPLSLKVEAGYQALGEFISALETHNTPVITVKSLDINKDEGIRPLSRVTIDLIVYLTGN